MKIEEFRFMLEKMVSILASTLSVKKQFIMDIYKAVESKLYPPGKDSLEKNEFIQMMLLITKEISKNLDEFAHKMQNFTLQVKKSRLPSYLEKDNLFLGKYMIKDVVPYSQIYEKNLLAQPSVFMKASHKRTETSLLRLGSRKVSHANPG